MQLEPPADGTVTVDDPANDDAEIVACWSCKGPVAATDLFCASCDAVQPPGHADHFTRLGLERGFEVDLGALEQAYFGLQRRLHPDRFATRTGTEKALSQQQATSLNEAYETLKDPLSRAVYLAGLSGLSVLTEGCNAITDPMILMEAMELREALAMAETAEDVERISKQTAGDITACEAALSRAFVAEDMKTISTLITRLKYLRKLADETRARRAQLRGGF